MSRDHAKGPSNIERSLVVSTAASYNSIRRERNFVRRERNFAPV